jgi:hypothetical protein
MSGATPDKSAPDKHGPDKHGEVTIDRLVFDIPGLDPTQAAALASDVAERLACAGLAGEHTRVGITLGPVGGSQAELAARITAALMQRLV